ncbi:hypothetical protein [Photorhabdus temperata]|uniref:hypothetical protein n=1 Tax=Photorhabdus temperata TaxID=574560 RepID=UPI00041085D9|nr:hypothetical protein [Photorhabdus temperata]
MNKELHEANRLSWNAAIAAHNSHKGDQAAFLVSVGIAVTGYPPAQIRTCATNASGSYLGCLA